jgi:hypothetical protein
MTEESFDMPDMDELARQMEDAMSQARQAMQELPTQMEGLGDVMGALSSLMGDMPSQMAGLGEAVSSFEEQHSNNVQELAGDPDWSLKANIRVGASLEVVVTADFDLQKVVQAWESTQGEGLESLVAGLVQETSGDDLEPGVMGQVMGQLKKGRGMAVVRSVEVRKCNLPGAPGNAAEKLQLSPEANISLVLHEEGLGFEFAPMLTIRNKWDNADIPTFSPMGDEVTVELSRFDDHKAFSQSITPAGQTYQVKIDLNLSPID